MDVFCETIHLQTLSERKRKAAEERRKLEEDMEDAKISYEVKIRT